MVLQLLHVPERSLYKSEPPPAWFGNPENERSTSWTAPNWLTSRFHFSFAEWRGGPSSFGALRVLNDDLVQPHRGFGRHPHRDMEIVTYIIDGAPTCSRALPVRACARPPQLLALLACVAPAASLLASLLARPSPDQAS